MKISMACFAFGGMACWLAANAAMSQDQPPSPQVGNRFDIERNLLLMDSDQDDFPDLTESLEGTNPLDPDSYPGKLSEEDKRAIAEADAGFVAPACRPGFDQIGAVMCITPNVFNAASFANAMVTCRGLRSRVANYGDLRFLYLSSNRDASFDPSGRWIGNFVGDDTALCGKSFDYF